MVPPLGMPGCRALGCQGWRVKGPLSNKGKNSWRSFTCTCLGEGGPVARVDPDNGIDIMLLSFTPHLLHCPHASAPDSVARCRAAASANALTANASLCKPAGSKCLPTQSMQCVGAAAFQRQVCRLSINCSLFNKSSKQGLLLMPFLPPAMASCSATAITATGVIWSRYSMVITPKNWNLFSVNIFMALTGSYQLARKVK